MQKSIAKLVILLACVWTGFVSAHAQTVYSCDFENATERALWQLNTGTQGPTCENKWYMGALGNHSTTGNYGLFVSSDNGTTTNYTASKTMFVVAYRDNLNLPTGTYDLTFDWLARGKATGDGLYVCWVPMTQNTNSASNAGGVPAWVTTYVCDTVRLSSAASWKVAKMKVHSTGVPSKLVFVWFNTAGSALPPAACVDNIEIAEENTCLEPTNLHYTISGTTLTLAWNGTAPAYDVKCYDGQNGNWQEFSNLTTKSVNVENLSEGVHTFYVRSVCSDSTHSAYVQYTTFVYMEGVRCIDYMSLRKATCYTGTTSNPRSSTGVVDYGYESERSRHTIHYMPQEYDPRTDNQLKTVPAGELASVRLGNWLVGAEAECIEYRYAVQAGASEILKLKYAVVLQNPGHSEEAQPRFTLDIMKGNGQPIPFGCGSADFKAGFGDLTSWNQAGSSSNAVLWKDWTEVSVNLRDYVGQTLTIRLTTYDCTASGHYGYAYFTLGCASGELSGLNCGDIPTTQFIGPSGFDYRWYLPETPSSVLGTSQIFNVGPMDTLTYYCDVISRTNTNCYYTLAATGIPRYPVPECTYTVMPVNCENVVTFNNTSHIMTVNQISTDSMQTVLPVETLLWDFGDGTVQSNLNSTVMHTYPKAGGTYTVRLLAGISNDICQVPLEMTLNLPDLSVRRYVQNVNMCDGEMYSFNGHYYFNSAVDSMTLTSAVTGCDSVVVLNLTVHDRTPQERTDSICSDEPYVFDGHTLTQTGDYEGQFTNRFGCDSVVTLHLTVLPKMEVLMADTLVMCADESSLDMSYTPNITTPVAVQVSFDAYAVAAGFAPTYNFAAGVPVSIPTPAGIRPDYYHATVNFDAPWCSDPQKSVVVQVNYAHSIIEQKSGFVALLNSDFNGGYKFTRYQWYRNGQPIEGATESYIFVDTQDVGAEYSVEVVREGENIPLNVCPISFVSTAAELTNADAVSVVPTLLTRGQNFEVRGLHAPAQVRICDVLGHVLSSEWLNENNYIIQAPNVTGIYFVEMRSADVPAKTFKISVK